MGRITSAFSLLAGAWRSRPLSRRILWVLALLMALTGAGMVSWPFVTDFISGREQSRLSAEFESPEFRARSGSAEIAPGHVVVRVVIPSIGVDSLVVEGTDPKTLRAGAGRYQTSARPCNPGNVAIAGHRNIYGKPFLRLDELRNGDEIRLVTPERSCAYKVVEGPAGTPRPSKGAAGWITNPDDGSVIRPLPGSMLTLTTCHPKNHATKRLIIRAKLA